MEPIEELRKKRFQFSHRLYELTKGSRYEIVNMFEVGEEIGFNRELTDLVTQYLEGEGLIKFQTVGGGIGITHEGVLEVEEAISNPDTPTTYFPPFNFIYVGQMIDSQIQQASPGATATITVLTSENLQAILQAVEQAKEEVGAATDIPGRDKGELLEVLEDVHSEAQKDNPNSLKLKSLLATAATSISNVASLNSAYQSLKAVASLVGISLP